MTDNLVLQTIKQRRTIRAFEERQLGDEELSAILEAAIWAPSGHNDQPWHFALIQNPEMLQAINRLAKQGMMASGIEWMQRMAAADRFDVLYNAPSLVMVFGRRDATSPHPDCHAAIQNMLLAAQSLGIGSAWLGLVAYAFRTGEAVPGLTIPPGFDPIYGVALGYPKAGRSFAPPERRSDTVSYYR